MPVQLSRQNRFITILETTWSEKPLASDTRKDTFLPRVRMSSNPSIIVLSGLRTLLITSNDGAMDNQYRIRQQHVEFRTVAPGGPPNSDRSWRVLDDDELQLHFALHTPVAEWLEKNLFARAAA